jgi:hypothetical protein
MRFVNPFTTPDFDRADTMPEQPEMKADAWFIGVQAYVQFVEEFLKPQITALLGVKQPREQAVLDIYYGIVGYLVSVNALRDPWHAQTIANCSRSIFEIYTDLLLLHADKSGSSVERFHAFVDVERLRAARERIKFSDDNPAFTAVVMTDERLFVAGEGARIDAVAQRLWPPHGSTRHWSGRGRLKERVAIIGKECEVLYWQYYAHLSWYVHTASVGVRGLSPKDVHLIIANALELVRQAGVHTFRVTGEELRFDKAIDGFGEKLDFLANVPYLRLVALKLGQPERFNFLDPVA